MSGHTVPAPDRVLGSTGYHIRHVDGDLAIDAGTQLKKNPRFETYSISQCHADGARTANSLALMEAWKKCSIRKK